MYTDSCLSNTDFKFGGHLSVEDAQGRTENTFLQDGFFDFLNKVHRRKQKAPNSAIFISRIRIISIMP